MRSSSHHRQVSPWKWTSPHNAQSNGHAEAVVKNMKYLLSNCGNFGKEFQQHLYKWRNSTTASFSPAQLSFGRKLHTTLPALDKQYRPPSHFPSKTKEKQCSIKAKAQFDQHAKKLPPLRVGQKVHIQEPVSKKWDTIGTITNKRDNSKF